ncbi:actin-like protein ARP9 [Scheffersomyces xylosifermentans]|uniref:actin-like protein ARP9 n=1 Tax=Scheffersomyces xylosifermentans TaxID=1304137 RepID=UPI00315C7C52
MPLYKEENFLVVHPGTQHTLFSFGLQDSLSPPQYKIPSVVYQDPVTKEYKSKRDENGDNLVEVFPIKASKVVDLDAFNYLLKIILQSVITNNPIVTINQIPLLLIVPLTWSRSNIEYITKYVIESLEFTAFNIIDLSLASTFGVGPATSSVVVNVGYDSVQVVPVVNYQSIKFAAKYLTGVGGQTLNEEIKKILPQFTDQQVEDLKKSGIYEILNDHESTFYSLADLANEKENDDDFDVAKIVVDDEKKAAVLENGEENGEEQKPNRELERNFFIDSKSGEKVYVGKERFQGSSKLVSIIATLIYDSLTMIRDLDKRQECYDNIILVGSTFKIPGLKEAVLVKLSEEYLIREPGTERGAKDANGINVTLAKYQQAEDSVDPESGSTLAQVPNSIKLARYPDYFPEWKKPKEKGGSWDDVFFLGGEIYGKQIFSNNSNHGRELFIDSDVYEERGPQSIWDVSI